MPDSTFCVSKTRTATVGEIGTGMLLEVPAMLLELRLEFRKFPDVKGLDVVDRESIEKIAIKVKIYGCDMKTVPVNSLLSTVNTGI
ncbi:MAG: hypothetical protein HC941_24385 [Microcoleus sp. SU_5_3]|nr:hypothetical protein [Microcoleus sp. SU_5_3]